MNETELLQTGESVRTKNKRGKYAYNTRRSIIRNMIDKNRAYHKLSDNEIIALERIRLALGVTPLLPSQQKESERRFLEFKKTDEYKRIVEDMSTSSIFKKRQRKHQEAVDDGE